MKAVPAEKIGILSQIVDYLRNEAEDLMKSCLAREDSAKAMTDGTDEDFRSAHRIAEQMSGRKLRRTNEKERSISAEIDLKIASKQEVESRKLSMWADELSALAAAAVDVPVEAQGKPYARPVIGPNTHRGEDGSVSVLGTSTGVDARPVTDEQKREMVESLEDYIRTK